MQTLEIKPAPGPILAKIRPPGSKSLTNRALVIAAMAHGKSVLCGALHSDDTHVMVDSLQRLGLDAEHLIEQETMTVHGQGGRFQTAVDLFIGNSGTSVRFLTAMLAFAGGSFLLDGLPRMRERPIGPLVDALNQLGANVVAQSPNQCPPVKIESTGIRGGQVSLPGNLSSQYLSGLLMASPLAEQDIQLEIVGPLISRPYVEMTCRVMESFGVEVERESHANVFRVAGGQSYQPSEYWIEPDASAASYFWAAAAILGGTATVEGLNEHALQGDVGFVRCLEQMGCTVSWGSNSIAVTGPATTGVTINMADVSDTVQTLAAVALFVEGPTTVTDVAHNRVKETDRIGNLAIELRKLGAKVIEHEDGLTIQPGPFQAAEIDTYDDHRMAMSLALTGLKHPGVVIRDPQCVSKTYPDYFADMRRFVS